MWYPSVEDRSVIVTGASGGIGRATARVLRAQGWRVFPTARRGEDIESLKSEGFEALFANMDDGVSLRALVDTVLKLTGGKLGALVNNAGYGQPGALEDLSRETMRAQFETNVFGLQELTNLCLPTLRRQGWGRIVHISSVAGRLALPFMGIYSASKFAVEAMADALRVELFDSGIAVCLVEPGSIESAFRQRSVAQAETELDLESAHFANAYRKNIDRRKGRRKQPDRFTLPPEVVGRKVAQALESAHPRARYCVTLPACVGAILASLCPTRWLDTLFIRKARKRVRV
ncbi:MAG: SDR family NAD(P)-dependent oxidoreductase [Kiritimatiellae bacterium]|nr:SDR family NAD(P)-dependent oxidoreductase [Kiritimatiellia bacterium]